MTDLFPPTPLGLANENFKSLLETLRETLKQLGRDVEVQSTSPSGRVPCTTQQETLASSTDNDSPTSTKSADHFTNHNDSKSLNLFTLVK